MFLIIIGQMNENIYAYLDYLFPIAKCELNYNKDYEFTASMGSLALAKEFMDEDFLLVEGDTFYEKKVIEQAAQERKEEEE